MDENTNKPLLNIILDNIAKETATQRAKNKYDEAEVKKVYDQVYAQLQQIFNTTPDNQELLTQLLQQLLQYKHLLSAWTIANEKALIKEDSISGILKELIDNASSQAVEEWTEKLKQLGYIETVKGREFPTITDSINHHIDNLISGGMWDPNNRPILKEETINLNGVNINTTKVTVSNCAYKTACESGLDVDTFTKGGQYRCQRLGCFVGAVQKYMRDDKLSEDDRKQLAYLMTTVNMNEQGDCEGLIVIDQGDLVTRIYNSNRTQFIKRQVN